jgi:glycosyltransferase involved in cell wall biosynthesis
MLEMADLPLLKAMGKKIIVTYQGCDARLKSYSVCHYSISMCHDKACYGGRCNEETDTWKQFRMNKVAKYADLIFALNPDLLNVLPSKAKFLPYTTVDLDEWQPTKRLKNERLTVIHSPTNREAKGTKWIAHAMNRLTDRYKSVDFKLVEGVPHDKVKELYQQADLAIDQVLAGWYGGFAVETMALGIPTIAYIRESDIHYIPEQMDKDMAIIRTTPQSVYNTVLLVLDNLEALRKLGKDSREYVETYHDPIKIAESVWNNPEFKG